MAESGPKVLPHFPAALKEGLRFVLSLREEDLRKMNAWAKVNIQQVISGDGDFDVAAEGLDVPISDFYRSIQLIANLLFRGEPSGSFDLSAYSSLAAEFGGDFLPKL